MFSSITAFVAGGVASYVFSKSRKSPNEDGEEDSSAVRRESRGITVVPRSAVGVAAQHSDVFLSDLLAQLWHYISEAASQAIKETVEPEFKELPGPLKTLHFTNLDIGNVPIRLDNIVVHDVEKDTNTLQMNLDVLWDGNCSIELKADYLGSFGVRKIKLFGRMSILLKPLVSTLSIVQAIQVSFINPPTIELDFVGLANIADMKVLKRRIHVITQDMVKGMSDTEAVIDNVLITGTLKYSLSYSMKHRNDGTATENAH